MTIPSCLKLLPTKPLENHETTNPLKVRSTDCYLPPEPFESAFVWRTIWSLLQHLLCGFPARQILGLEPGCGWRWHHEADGQPCAARDSQRGAGQQWGHHLGGTRGHHDRDGQFFVNSWWCHRKERVGGGSGGGGAGWGVGGGGLQASLNEELVINVSSLWMADDVSSRR